MTHPYIKCILLDVDGTLINKAHQIEPSIQTAVNQLYHHQIYCGVCTGRHYAALKQYVFPNFPKSSLHITSGGGAIIKSTGEIIWQQLILSDITYDIIEHVEAFGGAVAIGQGESLYCSDAILENLSSSPSKTQVDSLSSISSFETTLIYVTQINESIENYINHLSNLHIKRIISPSGKPYYDITASGVNKATTAMKLNQYLSLQMNQYMAIGDSDNDAEILAAVGYPVAMDHAPPHIQNLAKTTINTSSLNPVSDFLNDFFNLNLKHSKNCLLDH